MKMSYRSGSGRNKIKHLFLENKLVKMSKKQQKRVKICNKGGRGVDFIKIYRHHFSGKAAANLSDKRAIFAQ